MKPINEYNDSLLTNTVDMAIRGLLLAGVLVIQNQHLAGDDIVIISCYLALVSLWQLIWPFNRFKSYACGKIICLIVIAGISWWLINSTAEYHATQHHASVMQDRIHDMVKKSPAFILISSTDGIITGASNTMVNLTGYTAEELEGKPITFIMSKEIIPRKTVELGKAIQSIPRKDIDHVGWMIQDEIQLHITRKDKTTTLVRAYTGGVCWSTNLDVEGTIDIFAIFVPEASLLVH